MINKFFRGLFQLIVIIIGAILSVPVGLIRSIYYTTYAMSDVVIKDLFPFKKTKTRTEIKYGMKRDENGKMHELSEAEFYEMMQKDGMTKEDVDKMMRDIKDEHS